MQVGVWIPKTKAGPMTDHFRSFGIFISGMVREAKSRLAITIDREEELERRYRLYLGRFSCKCTKRIMWREIPDTHSLVGLSTKMMTYAVRNSGDT